MRSLSRWASWLRSVASWLFELRLLWLGIVVPILAFWVASFWSTEQALRICGMIIEALGTCFVVAEILKSRRTFGAPTATSWFKDWFKRFPKLGSTILSVQGASHMHFGGSAHAHMWHGAGEGSGDARISALEKNLTLVRDLAYKLEREVERVENDLSGELKRNAEVLNTSVQDLRKQMVAANTDGHLLAAIGILWVLIGLIASTSSDLIVKFLL
jgi:hypothetical protein